MNRLFLAPVAFLTFAPFISAAQAATDPPQAAPIAIAPAVADTLPIVPVRQIGNLSVRKYGTGKQAVVLVPGLACGAWVWDQTVLDFQKDYTIYTVTLAGFDGTTPFADQDDLLDQAVTSLSQLISTEKLVNPIIVGHSLGGHLALRLAAKQSDTLGGVVIVDSLPLFPPLQPGETLDQRKKTGPIVAQQLMKAPDADYAAQEHQSCAYLVTDPKEADAVADKSLKSDRATVAHALSQMMSTDLSTQLPKITGPRPASDALALAGIERLHADDVHESVHRHAASDGADHHAVEALYHAGSAGAVRKGVARVPSGAERSRKDALRTLPFGTLPASLRGRSQSRRPGEIIRLLPLREAGRVREDQIFHSPFS